MSQEKGERHTIFQGLCCSLNEFDRRVSREIFVWKKKEFVFNDPSSIDGNLPVHWSLVTYEQHLQAKHTLLCPSVVTLALSTTDRLKMCWRQRYISGLSGPSKFHAAAPTVFVLEPRRWIQGKRLHLMANWTTIQALCMSKGAIQQYSRKNL